jgi:hypothetical protein
MQKYLITNGSLIHIQIIPTLIIIFILYYIYNHYYYYNNTENFTSKMTEMYTPYVRHAGFYKKNKSDISNLFRKFGIM